MSTKIEKLKPIKFNRKIGNDFASTLKKRGRATADIMPSKTKITIISTRVNPDDRFTSGKNELLNIFRLCVFSITHNQKMEPEKRFRFLSSKEIRLILL